MRQKLSESVKASYTEQLKKARSDTALNQWHDPSSRALKVSSMRRAAAKRSPEARSKSMKEAKPPSSPLSLLRSSLYTRADGKCENCGRTEAEEVAERGGKLHLHHHNNDRIVATLDDVMLLCSSCHHSLHGDGHKRERYEAVTKTVGQLLQGLKVDLTDENFSETPRRFASYLLEHFMTEGEVEQALEELQCAAFPSDSRDIVSMRNVQMYGMCPHHLLPIFYNVALAYIPQGRVVGLSKLARLAKLCGRLPLLQESMTVFLANGMQRILETENVAVVVVGEHLCMRVRGPEVAGTDTVTSAMFGCFRTEAETRAEVLALMGRTR